MMDFKKFIAVFIAINSIGFVESQYGSCDYEARISAAGSSIKIDHYTYTGNCRYKVIAPINTFMQATCKSTFVGNCANQNLTISRSGEKELIDGLFHCTSSSFVRQSVGNEFVFAFRSLIKNSGSFGCTVTAVAQTNTNCDCSWNVNSKIVGGTVAGMNEFTPLAGIVDLTLPNFQPYCGGIVSKSSMSDLIKFII